MTQTYTVYNSIAEQQMYSMQFGNPRKAPHFVMFNKNDGWCYQYMCGQCEMAYLVFSNVDDWQHPRDLILDLKMTLGDRGLGLVFDLVLK